MILYFGKSAVNPLIYGWKNRDFRHAFARLLRYLPCKWLGGGAPHDSEYGVGSRRGSRNISRAGSVPSTWPAVVCFPRDYKDELPHAERHITSTAVLAARHNDDRVNVCVSAANQATQTDQQVSHV